MIPDLFSVYSTLVTSDQYAAFFFLKASKTFEYKRSFNKIDDFFSYVGGLIGTILGFMLFMSNFSMMSFELDLAGHFFKGKED